jgi:hypothetical protein
MFRSKNGIVNTSDYAIFNYLGVVVIGFLFGQGLLTFTNAPLWILIIGSLLIILANISLCFFVYTIYLRHKAKMSENI